MQPQKYKLFILLLLLVFLSALFSQSDYQQQYREGLRLYRAGLLHQAYHYFNDLQKDYPDSLGVLHALGAIDFRQQRWKKAVAWYNKVLDIDEKDINAHYHNAICYREIGKYKAFVLRKRDWSRSEENFKLVLDSLEYYKDSYLQYAILLDYQKKFAEAIDFAKRQLKYEPSTKAGVAVHRFYESLLYHDGLKKLQASAAKDTSAISRFYLGEGYRIKKDYAKADSIYKSLLGDSAAFLSHVPVYIALSKSMGEQDSSQACQYFFEQALDAVNNDLDAALMFENVKYVFSDAEYKEYRDLENWQVRREFLKRMWVKRNPMPAAEVNYRIVEHVRRFVYAERNFYYDGFRLPFNNPDRLNVLQFPRVFDLNDKFNDKGLVYIRHGEPDDRAFSVSSGPLNESWLYYPRGQLNKKMIFHFWQGETQTGQNWRMVASIPAYLAESRSNFDHLYSRLMTADPLEAISIEHQMEIASKENVKVGLNTDQHKWAGNLRSIFFPFYAATFRQDKSLTRSEFYFSLSTADVAPNSASRVIEDSVTIDFAVFDENYAQLEKQVKKVPIRDIVDSTVAMGYWPGQINYVGAPEMRQVALDIRTPNDEAIGGYKFRFLVSNYDGDALKMSGIELAHSIRSGPAVPPFHKRGLNIIPNAQKLFPRKKNIDIYFEVYNVPKAPGTQTPFFIDYQVRLLKEKTSGLINKLAQLFGKQQPVVANRIERETSDAVSPEYIALNLEKYAPGVYELEIKVQTAAKDSVSRKTNFELK